MKTLLHTREKELDFLNPFRTRDLELRFGPYVRQYYSSDENFFLTSIEQDRMSSFPILTCRDGSILIEDLLKYRPRILSKPDTQLAFHWKTISTFPHELRNQFLYYRMEEFSAPFSSARRNLLVLNCDANDMEAFSKKYASLYENVFFLKEDFPSGNSAKALLSLEELYRSHSLRDFSFTYGSTIIPKTGDCFLTFLLMRKGANELKSGKEIEEENELRANFKEVRTVPLSFRHCRKVFKIIR